MKPWTVKYQPQTLDEIQGQDSAVAELKDFVQNFKKQKKKALLLYGDVGNGKTSSVYALAHELNLELLEINASDLRDEEKITQVVGGALKQQSLFFKSKIVLMDEVDGISGREDRGGIPALVDLIKTAHFPVIMTANDPWDKKFSTLRNNCVMVEFGKLRYTSILPVLKRIAEKENLNYDETALRALARRADGDLRGAIIDLQSLAIHNKTLTEKDLDNLGTRRQAETILNLIMRIFKTTEAKIALDAVDQVDEDPNELFLWLDENLPKEYAKPHDLYRAYERLSRADIFKERIHRRQHWRFLVYIKDLLSAGVALSKDEKYPGFTRYQRTQRILKLWQSKMKNAKKIAIAEKLAQKTHSSIREVIKNTLPFFQHLFNHSPLQQKQFIKEFDLAEEEVAWLKKSV